MSTGKKYERAKLSDYSDSMERAICLDDAGMTCERAIGLENGTN
jgi:hypothetical protein